MAAQVAPSGTANNIECGDGAEATNEGTTAYGDGAVASNEHQLTSLELLWSIMAAVDHANRTGNYSVLRDLGSAAFQSRNNPANLAAIFAGLRDQRVDLSSTLVVTPTWEIAPTMVQPGTLRMRGSFPLRPAAILFDLLFLWDGGWRLDGVAVQAQPAPR